jgi:hypothetical protein
MIVEKQMECRLAGETEILGENLPQRLLSITKSQITRPGHSEDNGIGDIWKQHSENTCTKETGITREWNSYVTNRFIIYILQ